MAKAISSPNIAVTVSTGDVKPKVDGVNKALAELSGKPVAELAKHVNADLTAVNKDIRSTIENLYKLRAELAKGGDTSKLTQQLKNQLGKIDKGTAGKGKGTASKDDGKAIEAVGQTANELLGGKFDLGKAAKFGIAGIVGSIVSDLGAAVTDGLVKAKDAGGGFGDYTKALGESLPIIGGMVKTVENIDELWTGNRKAAEDYTKQIALADEATKTYRDTLKDVAAQRDAFNVTMGNERRSYHAGQRGGVEGRVERAKADYDDTAATLAADARKQKQAIDEQLKAQIAAQEKGVKDAGPSRRSNDAAAQARKSADQNIKLLKDAAKQRTDEIDTEVTVKLKFEAQKRDDTIAQAQGMSPQLAAAEDAIESLKKQTDSLDGDPFAAMRKSFESLKPGETLLAEFDRGLAQYKDRLEEVADEAKKFNATKAATDLVKDAPDADKLIGLNAVDRQVQQLRNDGVTDEELLRKVKVTLDTTEAKQRAEDLKQTIEGLNTNIKLSLADNLKERIAVEVDAESERRKKATGQGYTEEEKKQLRKAKEDDAYASRAAQTKEAVKYPSEKLGDSINDLKEQFARGYINEAQLNKGVGQSLQGYADSMRTNRPDLIEADSAAAQQLAAVGSGAAIDASRPELVIAREQKDLLGEIRDAIKEQRPVKVSIGS